MNLCTQLWQWERKTPILSKSFESTTIAMSPWSAEKRGKMALWLAKSFLICIAEFCYSGERYEYKG